MPTLLNTVAAVVDALTNAPPGSTIYLDLHSPDTPEGAFGRLVTPRHIRDITLVGRVSGSERTTFQSILGDDLTEFSFVSMGVRGPKVEGQSPGVGRFDRCEGLQFRDFRVDGVDRSPQGLTIGTCRDVVIEDCEFVNCFHGLVGDPVNGIVVKNCDFHEIRCDGLHGAWEAVRIEGCDFHDFHPEGDVGNTGDHSDAIQFYCNNVTPDDWDNGTNPVGFEVLDCRIWRGTNPEASQGVFFRQTSGMPFQDVTIRDVGVFGGMVRSISMGDSVPTSTLVIDRCEVCSWSDGDAENIAGIWQPNYEDGDQGVYQITNCAAQAFQNSDGVPEGCELLPSDLTREQVLERQAAWMAAHPR